MSKQNALNIGFEDYFNLVIVLIGDDLKIQRHFHFLSLSGVDVTPLKLRLHETILKLIGFKEKDLTPDLEDWYFAQTEKVNNIDILQDEEILLKVSTEIFNDLVKQQKMKSRKSL